MRKCDSRLEIFRYQLSPKPCCPDAAVVFTGHIHCKDPYLIPTHRGLGFELVGMYGNPPRRNKALGLLTVNHSR